MFHDEYAGWHLNAALTTLYEVGDQFAFISNPQDTLDQTPRNDRLRYMDLTWTLEDGPRHGYAVIESLRQNTGGRLDLPTGTIYPALRRLEQAGLITGSWAVVGGRRRREYKLTAAGTRALSGKRADWLDFSAMVSAALEGRPCPSPA